MLGDPKRDALLKRIDELHFEKATRNSENYWTSACLIKKTERTSTGRGVVAVLAR